MEILGSDSTNQVGAGQTWVSSRRRDRGRRVTIVSIHKFGSGVEYAFVKTNSSGRHTHVRIDVLKKCYDLLNDGGVR